MIDKALQATPELPPTQTPRQAYAACMMGVYQSISALTQIMREEYDEIKQRDPLERFIIDQDAAKVLVEELESAKQLMETAFKISQQEEARRKNQERLVTSGLILPASMLKN